MADAGDLKSPGGIPHEGSTPSPGTNPDQENLTADERGWEAGKDFFLEKGIFLSLILPYLCSFAFIRGNIQSSLQMPSGQDTMTLQINLAVLPARE